ncbi:MAG: Crp/Fnr family transcriptional regulator [Bdellovibrionales bacterium]
MNNRILSLVEKYGHVLRLEAGQKVFSEGDSCQNFVVLKNGTIKVFKNSEKGREFVLYRVTPDYMCVLTTTCMLSKTPYAADAVAESDVEALVLDQPSFDRLIVESKEFREMVFKSLSARFQGFVEKIDEVVFHSLKERLKEFLVRQKGPDGKVHMTHQELAAELGTEREVISRLLSQLKKDHLVDLGKGEVFVIT